MDIEIKKIIDLHKLDQQILEINENKGALPSIIKEQEEQINDLVSLPKEQVEDLLIYFKMHGIECIEAGGDAMICDQLQLLCFYF